jgi:hypothetical protein
MKKIYIIFILCIIRNLSNAQGTWSEQTVPTGTPGLYSVSAVSFNVCWASGLNGTVLYTSNGGLNWVNRSSALFLNNSVNVVCGFDSLIAVCAITITQPPATVIYRTTNGGLAWQPVYIQANGNIRDIKLFSPGSSSAYSYGDPVSGIWTFLVTTNMGATFSQTGLPLPQSGNEHGWYRAMAVGLGGLSVWFGTSSAKIYISFTGGFPFLTSFPQFQNVYTIAFALDGLLGFAGGNPNSIASTTNGGLLWILQNSLPGSGDCNATASAGLLGLEFWYARGTEIFYSMNGGLLNFSLQYTSPVNGTYEQLSFVSIDLNDNIESTIRGWGVTNNGSMSVYNGGVLRISNNNYDIPNQFSLFQNYPNPFNPSTNINYQLPISGFVKLTVYDELGKEIRVLVNEKQNAGSYKIGWDASNYSSGIYFYRLETSEFTQTKKMLFIK